MSVGRISNAPPASLGPAAVSAKTGYGGQSDHPPVHSDGGGADISALISSIEHTTEAARTEGAGLASSQLGNQLLSAVRSLVVVLSVHPSRDVAEHSERAKAAMKLVEDHMAVADESAYRLAERIQNSGRARHNWEEYSQNMKDAILNVRQALK